MRNRGKRKNHLLFSAYCTQTAYHQRLLQVLRYTILGLFGCPNVRPQPLKRVLKNDKKRAAEADQSLTHADVVLLFCRLPSAEYFYCGRLKCAQPPFLLSQLFQVSKPRSSSDSPLLCVAIA